MEGSHSTTDWRKSPFEESLTVKKNWKVDEELHSRVQASNKPSVLVPIAKWIATTVLAAGLFACLIASKLYMLKLAVNLNTTSSRLNTTSPQPVDAKVRTKATHLFLMIFLALVLPYFLNFLRALFVALGRKDMPWPSTKSILLGILSATVESFGMCVFSLKVLTYYDGVVAILLMNSVFIFPFFINLILSIISLTTKNQVQNETRPSCIFICCLLGFLFQCAGVVFALIVSFEKAHKNLSNMWHVFLSLGCLSVAWTPKFLKSLVAPMTVKETEGVSCPRQNPGSKDSSQNVPGPSTTADKAEDNNEEKTDDSNDAQPSPTKMRMSSWKMSIISNFVKVVFVMIFSFIFFYVDSSVYSNDSIFKPETHEEFLNAWTFEWDEHTTYFVINILATIGGYALAFIACHTAIHKWAFAIPILATGPGFVLILTIQALCEPILVNTTEACIVDSEILWKVLLSTCCLFVAQLVTTTVPIFQKKILVLQKESTVFWIPTFNCVLLEQWLILNNRILMDKDSDVAVKEIQETQVYICTTMYRETVDEMRQLLESINRINLARKDNDRFFESHIFFDGGIKNMDISKFALQLLTLLSDTLNIKPEDCAKIKTPYGLKLIWDLPVLLDIKTMKFNIHLKDNKKVKNKKRWSQVMYMSYVIDFCKKSKNCYILTTDADVKFTKESVEALLDIMTRDKNVGAVCARTHPMGKGPILWYQIFEYAIGHWFQKTAEHTLGSVLCAPGCFSVYRCEALREILPKYVTNVEHAFDFLTKDMGEDRWLCTLLVQSGWLIDYCAVSENSTNCPSDFKEFYKQRRRWIASTIANLMLLIRQWQIIRHFNQRISLLFLVYQGALLFSTLIGPSTVILIISGGVTYAWKINPITSAVIQVVICVLFAVICLCTSEKTQILTAKLLTFIYAIVMTAVVVGTAEQIVSNVQTSSHAHGNHSSTTPPTGISIDIPVPVSTIYLAAIASIFVITALLHLKELYCLLHGIWYLLCLPSAYLVLIIYSICNITDRSWGTREENTDSGLKTESWHHSIGTNLKNIFRCCWPKSEKISDTTNSAETKTDDDRSSFSTVSMEDNETYTSVSDKGADALDTKRNLSTAKTVETFLPPDLKAKYRSAFEDNGYENTMFISGMTEEELMNIGVNIKGHIQAIQAAIDLLPSFEIEYTVPSEVGVWLDTIGLSCYSQNFKMNHIKEPEDLSVLTLFDRDKIIKELKITKTGHIKRLLYAIRRLRHPTESERKATEIKKTIDTNNPSPEEEKLDELEEKFWTQLLNSVLKPENKAFGIEGALKKRLGHLRNSWLLILTVTNILWLILIITLASKGDLTILGANPLGLSFLFIFGTLLVVQFLAMIFHRISTLVHFLARAPFKYGEPMKFFWSFEKKSIFNYESSTETTPQRHDNQHSINGNDTPTSRRQSEDNQNSGHPDSDASERTPLLENPTGGSKNTVRSFEHVIQAH